AGFHRDMIGGKFHFRHRELAIDKRNCAGDTPELETLKADKPSRTAARRRQGLAPRRETPASGPRHGREMIQP
ncbi:hypothetical protein ABTE31_21485, partial [Acinetobacter baumannii]